MRTIHESFDDDIFEKMQQKKDESGKKNWREFIIYCILEKDGKVIE